MKIRFYISLLLLLNVTFLYAQNFKVRECFESEIPSGRRAKYFEEAHQVVQDFYTLLLESVGNTDNRDVIIEQLINDSDASTLKTDFLLVQDRNLSFCNPLQYFTKFESIYKDMVEKVEFVVENFKDGKIMMNSLVSCYIPVEYDLTLMEGGQVLFKRRCRMYCLFPKVSADKLVKVMQIEPVKDIIAYKPLEKETDIAYQAGFPESDTPDIWFEKGVKFYEKKEYTQAVEWWIKAAEQGYSKAQYNLGRCHENGYGVPKSYKKAVKWYTKAAEQGHTDAQCELGGCYHMGRGVRKSFKKAVEWYTKAAEQGDASALLCIGHCYEEGGFGIQQSDKKAVECFTKAAEQGNVYAQFFLGLHYKYGISGVKKSYKKAVEWFTKAAEQGYALAQSDLGDCYEEGGFGIQQSYETAVEWYRKSANNGSKVGQNKLGICYEKGHGVPQSFEKAVEWFTKAAEQGYSEAQYNLGRCHENGYGVPKSYKKAVEWYTKAAKQKHIWAKSALEKLKKQ